MTTSISRSFAILRPDDDGLSAEARDRIQVYRLLCLLAAPLLPLFGVAYEIAAPDAVDPFWVRLGFMGLYIGLVVLSYVARPLRHYFVSVVQGSLYLVLAWYTAIAGLNGFTGSYAIGLPVTFTVLSVPFGIGITTLRPLLWFLGYGTLLIGAAVAVVPTPQTSPFVLFSCILLLDLLLGIVVHAQLSMRRTLKRTMAEAQAANQLKSALLSNMSHEVRTPLTSILGFAELIAEADAENPQALATRIHDSGERLLDTLNTVLQVSRLESGTVELDPQHLDVAEVASTCIEAVEPMAQERNVRITLDRPDTPVSAYLDPDALRHILDALVRNAIEFSEAGDHAEIAVRENSHGVVLTVTDSGIGMTDAVRKEVFDAFQQGSVGQARTHEGIGLGLTVAHRLVHLLDGTIEVESEKGEGTRVAVRLPRRAPAPVPA